MAEATSITKAEVIDRDAARAFLAEQFLAIGKAETKEARQRAVAQFAEGAVKKNLVGIVLPRLANGDTNAVRLALELGQRLPMPIQPEWRALLLPLLKDAEVSSTTRLRTAAHLVRSHGESSREAREIFVTVSDNLPRPKAMQRLGRLRDMLPERTDIKQFEIEFAASDLRSCPACSFRGQREEFVRHLWREHNLLLDGEEIKNPWQTIEGWLGRYRENENPIYLATGCELSQKLDPVGGLFRFHRYLSYADQEDEALPARLHAEARRVGGSICPHCFRVVPRPAKDRHAEENLRQGLIEAHGCRLELVPAGGRHHLIAATPQMVLYDGPEPKPAATRQLGLRALGGFLLFWALLWALTNPFPKLPLLPVVWPLVGIGVALQFAGLLLRRGAEPVPDRLVDYGWSIAVPKLHTPNFDRGDAGFVAALAGLSTAHGDSRLREPLLSQVAQRTQVEAPFSPELAALANLELTDARQAGRDFIPLLANQIGFLFAGVIPISDVEPILEEFAFEKLNRSQRARLRVLLLQVAFESRWEVLDLHLLGRIFPQLGQLYASEDRKGMARLRWLWEVKGSRPWQALGSASSVFDLARYPLIGGTHLESHPDMLLFQPLADRDARGESHPISICEEGIVFRDGVLDGPDAKLGLRKNPNDPNRPLLQVGKVAMPFDGDPAAIINRLKGWLQFLYREFFPGVSRIATRRSAERLEKLRKQAELTCVECHRPFVAIAGELGLPLDVAEGER